MKGSKRKGWGSVLLLTPMTPHLPATMPTVSTMPTTINLCFPCFFWKDLENTEIKNLSSMLLFTSATFHPSTRCPPLLTSAHPAACTDMILSTFNLHRYDPFNSSQPPHSGQPLACFWISQKLFRNLKTKMKVNRLKLQYHHTTRNNISCKFSRISRI